MFQFYISAIITATAPADCSAQSPFQFYISAIITYSSATGITPGVVSILHKCDYNQQSPMTEDEYMAFQFYISAIITRVIYKFCHPRLEFQFYISAIITLKQ